MINKINIFYDKYKIFLLSLGFLFGFSFNLFFFNQKLGSNITSPHFIEDFIKFFFNFSLLNLAVLFSVRNIFWNFSDKLKEHFIFSYIISSTIFIFIGKYNNKLNEIVSFFFPFEITKVFLEGSFMVWIFIIIFFNFIVYLILSNYKKISLNKKKKTNDYLWIYCLFCIKYFSLDFFTFCLCWNQYGIHITTV